MKLIIGLGNPGPKYRNTRHNAGFMVLDLLAKNHGIKFKEAARAASEVAEGDNLILAKPLTFMNNSGVATSKLLQKYSLSAEDILVVYDDVDTPLGKIRLREKGSSGGHNGIKSIIAHIGEDFARLKIGIGKDSTRDTADHVLDKFTPEEKAVIDEATAQAATRIENWDF